MESTEASWADNFAKPLLAKRHQVDAGDATVSDLQIFYLQKDPSSWLTKSSTVLDQHDAGDRQVSGRNFANRPLRASTVSTSLDRLAELSSPCCSACSSPYYTAKSITEPLTHLITVAREIGDSGDLNQNIDIHRN